MKKKILIAAIAATPILFFAFQNCSQNNFSDNSVLAEAEKNQSLIVNDKVQMTSMDQDVAISWDVNKKIDASKIKSYEVCLGTASKRCDVIDWINVGLDKNYTFSTENLVPETRYFVSVRYIDTSNQTSSEDCGDGFSTPANTVKKIATGVNHTCAISYAGTLKCWGSNSYGELGYNDKVDRGHTLSSMNSIGNVFLGTGKSAKDIAIGERYSCALLNDNTIKCWGRGGYLGYGDNDNRGDVAGSMENLSTINLGAGRTALKLVAGTSEKCAILDNNQTKCWIGDSASSQPIQFGTSLYAKDIAIGYNHKCAVLNDNTVKCWGQNTYGQLGYNDTTSRSTPASTTVFLGTGKTAKKVTAGYNTSCAILNDNTVKCWGWNNSGQLGYEDLVSRGHAANSMQSLGTVNLGANRYAKDLVTGGLHYTCAVLDNGQVKCWGFNGYGQLGQNDHVNRGGAVGDMANLNGIFLGQNRYAKKVAAGFYHNCAILDNDHVKCWGINNYGQLGYGDRMFRGGTSVSDSVIEGGSVFVGTNRKVKDVAVGYVHSCAVLDDGNLKCWGDNWAGKLGYNDTVSRGQTANSMQSLTNINLGVNRKALQVVTGFHHTCALLDTGAVKCWGYNSTGQLGYNDTVSRGGTSNSMENLAEVNLGQKAKMLTAGLNYTCAILEDNSLKCWGDNVGGQLGYNSTATKGNTANSMESLQPVFLGTGRTAKKVAAASAHTCAILDDDSLKCWGNNGSGQLGYNDMNSRGHIAGSMESLQPVFLGAGRKAKDVAVAQNHTCAILDDNSVKCFGHGLQGNLGYGDSTNKGHVAGSMEALGTVNLGLNKTAKSIAAGTSTSCAILNDDNLKCWGFNLRGQLGYENNIQIYAPFEDPVLMPTNLKVKKVVSSKITNGGDTNYSCAILSDDSLKCWGYGGSGQLGNNDYEVNISEWGVRMEYSKPHLYYP